jgi:hypothetical protein
MLVGAGLTARRLFYSRCSEPAGQYRPFTSPSKVPAALSRAHVALTDDLAQLTGDLTTARDTTASTDPVCVP